MGKLVDALRLVPPAVSTIARIARALGDRDEYRPIGQLLDGSPLASHARRLRMRRRLRAARRREARK